MGRFVKQQGYLLIAAIVLVFIFAVVGGLIARSYIRKGEAVAQESQSKQAQYIAQSALAIAQRALVEKAVTCANINGSSQFTQASLLGGQMTVTGSSTVASVVLASGITASSTSLTVNNGGNLAPIGIVEIDNEQIGYYNKSGNTLNDLVRGINSTSAIAHNSSAAVEQDQCLLTATGAYPTFANAIGQHTIQEVLIKKLFNLPFGTPSILSAAEITLRGNSSITNSGVTTSSESFPGSTMVSGQGITIQGNAKTQVSDGSGGVVESSNASTTEADILANVGSINSSNLAGYYFGVPLSTMQGIADHGYNESNIDGVTNKIIWITGDLDITGNNTYNIGTPAAPVILIIDGNLDIAGTPDINFNGLLYVVGNIDITGNANISGDATIASEGSGNINPEVDLGGNMDIDLNPTSLENLVNLSPYVNYNYMGTTFLLKKETV